MLRARTQVTTRQLQPIDNSVAYGSNAADSSMIRRSYRKVRIAREKATPFRILPHVNFRPGALSGVESRISLYPGLQAGQPGQSAAGQSARCL